MPLIVVGISHKTAPIELREKLNFPSTSLEKILTEVKQKGAPLELTILSTCNRTEIYAASESSAKEWCVQFLAEKFGRTDLENYLYTRDEGEMVNHLFSVSSGLDSLVLGENEILKQVKDAYHLAQKSGLTGKLLNILFQRALYVGKLVRTHTAINQGAVSVGSVAVSLGEKIFGDLSRSTILIFGAGKMAEISTRVLMSRKVKRILVANRTVENARTLADKFKAQPFSLDEGLQNMAIADIVITSMAAPEPIIKKDFIETLMAKRQNRSLFLIDIGVPRNIDPSVHKLDNVYLYNIDDLESIVRDNIKSRSAEIQKAAEIVGKKSAEFLEWYHSLQSGKEKSFKHRSDFAVENNP